MLPAQSWGCLAEVGATAANHRILVATIGVALVLGAGAVALWRPWQSADRVETADIDAGRALAHACTVCHALHRGAAPRVGPHLWAVVGRPVAGLEGYGYSPALNQAGGTWTVDRLDRFIADPATAYPGNTMVYAGLADADDRLRLIAYLQTLAD